MTTPIPASDGPAERVPGRDFCPLDGEPLWLRIQSGGKPQLYIHADRLTWHVDASEKIKAASWPNPFEPPPPRPDVVALDGPENRTWQWDGENWTEVPDTASVLAGLRAEMREQQGRARGSRDHVRNTWDNAIALVEAAEQRLAEGRER